MTISVAAMHPETDGLNTWPAIETGYVVECATNAAGPWVSLGIAPTVTGNEATVTVKTIGAAKLFRLLGP